MKATRQIGFAAILALLSLACSSVTLVDTGTGGSAGGGSIACGGTGGSSGTAGSTATGGSTGTGGTGDLELPDCVKALVATCATGGTCGSVRTDAGVVSDLCFTSGVRVSFTDPVTDTRIARVIKADGSLCYSFEATQLITDRFLRRYIWKDPAGQVVATGSYSSLDAMFGSSVTCACGGQTSCRGEAVPGGPPPPCCDINSIGNGTCSSMLCQGRCL